MATVVASAGGGGERLLRPFLPFHPSLIFPSLSFLLLPRAPPRRGTPRNYGERKVTANEVAIQPFYHSPIPR